MAPLHETIPRVFLVEVKQLFVFSSGCGRFIALAGPWYTLSEYILGSGRVHQRGAALVLSLASILPLLLASSSAAIEVSIMGIAQCGYIAFLESNMTLLARQLV